MSRSQKDITWPKSIILAHFKGICSEFVKLISIHSGGRKSKAAQNASQRNFSSHSSLYFPIHCCSNLIMSLHLVLIQHSLQCFQNIYSSLKYVLKCQGQCQFNRNNVGL